IRSIPMILLQYHFGFLLSLLEGCGIIMTFGTLGFWAYFTYNAPRRRRTTSLFHHLKRFGLSLSYAFVLCLVFLFFAFVIAGVLVMSKKI
ncbi:MAG TPA: hypothetical protein VL947_01160, partial [Cytophagales bacterium]|nr:hypothetical protein [Cytophagales bacterium]